MAVVKVRRKNGWAWKATIRDVRGRQVSETFPYNERLREEGRDAAVAWETTMLAARAGGTAAPVRRGLPSFADYAQSVLAEHPVSTNSRERHWNNYRAHLAPALGDLRVDRITREQCQQVIDNAVNARTNKPLAATTRHILSATLLVVMGAATEEFQLPSNPAAGLRLPKYRRKRKPRHFEDDQLAALLAGAVDERWRRAYRIGAGLGLRQAELLALGTDLDDIDMDGRTYHVEHQVLTVVGVKNGVLTDILKTDASHRSLPMSKQVRKDMQWFLDNTPPGRPFLTRAGGGLYTRQAANVKWQTAVRRAGLDPRFTSHALRHTYASLLIRSGRDLLTVSRMLGHASIDETTRTYAHLMRGANREVAGAVDRFLKRGERRNARRAA